MKSSVRFEGAQAQHMTELLLKGYRLEGAGFVQLKAPTFSAATWLSEQLVSGFEHIVGVPAVAARPRRSGGLWLAPVYVWASEEITSLFLSVFKAGVDETFKPAA